jgi:hypothetical protein
MSSEAQVAIAVTILTLIRLTRVHPQNQAAAAVLQAAVQQLRLQENFKNY